MNETSRLGQKIIVLIKEYQPSEAVCALTRVLGATLVLTKKEGVTTKEIAKTTYKALLALMEDYQRWLKDYE